MRRRISEHVLWERFNGAGEDAHGNLHESWALPVSVGVYAVNPGTTADVEKSGHTRDLETPSLYVPSGTVFGHRDRVTARDVVYEVDGEPRRFRNPYGSRMDGNQINLKRVGG